MVAPAKPNRQYIHAPEGNHHGELHEYGTKSEVKLSSWLKKTRQEGVRRGRGLLCKIRGRVPRAGR